MAVRRGRLGAKGVGVARLLMILTYSAGGVAIGLGFYYVSSDPKLAMTSCSP